MIDFAARLAQVKYLNVLKFLVYSFFVSIFLLPGITFSGSLPEVRPEDLVVYGMLLTLLLIPCKTVAWNSGIQKYMLFLLVFMIWMLITQLGNSRLYHLSDYFEYYKMVKFGIVALTFYLIYRYKILDQAAILRTMRVIFCLVFALNMLHYFNILNYNPIVMPFYANELQLSHFGVNSLGEADVKRMLGVLGNPNNNAIMMGFFSIYFIVHSTKQSPEYKQNYILAGLAILMLLMSGSKTGVLSLVAVFAVYWLLSRMSLKQLLAVLGIGALSVVLINVFQFTYISSLWTVDWSANESWTGRIMVWQDLVAMIQKSPWIGYGPNKEYFYIHAIYSENEYVLMAWRYGLVGLLFYLLWILLPFVSAFRQNGKRYAQCVILFSTMLLVSAITNNPLSEPRILVLYAMLCGLMYANSEAEQELAPESKLQSVAMPGARSALEPSIKKRAAL
ncbi:MAG: O-antigen ligase family protein [Desulfosporosinus sp.]|jgi:O-antigen ligase